MSRSIELQVNIKQQPAAVFRALVETEQLRTWFAEEVAVDRDGKRYDFWGRFTPERPDRQSGHHELDEWQDNRLIRFRWHLRGADTTVEIRLEEQGEHTQLTLQHRYLPLLKSGQGSMLDFWDLALENLRQWLEQNQAGDRYDFSSKRTDAVELSVDIEASPDRVYDALINPDTLQRYIAAKAQVEPEVGGKYSFGWEGGGPIKILELEPNAKLSYSWTWPDEQPTVATWTLKGSGGSTRLTVVHSGFGDRPVADYGLGWWKFLYRIKRLLELGDAWERPAIAGQDWA